MKKIIVFFLFLMWPTAVWGRNVNYDVTDVYIDATILTNGDLQVKELIVLDGTFNGYERDLVYRNRNLKSNETIDFSQDAIYNASGIEDVSVAAKTITDEQIDFSLMDSSFLVLDKNYYEDDAVNGEYVERSIQDGKSYKMYYAADDEQVAFFLQYTLTDVVVLHEDVAEIYWTFVGENFDDTIENLQIQVHLPQEDSSNLFRIWTHGDLTATVNFVDRQSFLTSVLRVPRNTAIDVRSTFDKGLMDASLVTKQSGVSALDGILEVEEKRANDANILRETTARNLRIMQIVCVLFLVFVLAWWIYVYFRFDKEYKSTFRSKYNREFIDDYNVEVIDYLMNGNITENAMSASILNLIYKKNIQVEEMTDDKKSKKKKKEYVFTLLNRDGVNDTEDVLLDFLFETVGKDNKFTTKDLQQYASASKTFSHFQKSYTNWKTCVKKDGERQNFYEQNGLPIVSSIFILLIAVFILFLANYLGVDSFLIIVVLTISIVFLIYSLLIKKRTKKGNEDYVRWLAFKRFLEDFGRFDIKELPEIKLWERYLVYATIFGLADQVEKAMNVKIAEFSPDMVGAYYPTWVDFHIAHMVSSSVHHSIASNYTAISNSAIASSTHSSGSGFGGGGSLGGGFGGGGGGGRGF